MSETANISALTPERRNELLAALITLLITIVVGVLIFVPKLTYIPGAQQTWPPADSSELLFEGEYVMTGDIAQPEATATEPAQAAAIEEPATEGTDLTNEGEPAPVPTPVVTSERESPMKVTPPKEAPKTGPSKAEIAAQKAKEKAERETQQKIAGQMKFGSNSSAGTGKGKSGSPEGNSTTGALSGAPGYSLTGRSLEHWTLPVQPAPNGSVTVRVVVNQQGKVIEATVSRSVGAAANEAVRQACIAAAKRSQFSVKLDAAPRQSGTIPYKFVSK